MKRSKKYSNSQNNSNSNESLETAIKKIAQLIRVQVRQVDKTLKHKTRSTKILSTSPLTTTFHNSLEQVAKLLRSQIRAQDKK